MIFQTGYTSSNTYTSLHDLRRNYIDLCLSYCGTQACEASDSFGPHTRTEYVLHIVRSGKGIFQMNGVTYSLSTNDIFLIPPDVETYYEADSRRPWTYSWIGFQGTKAYECINKVGLSIENPTLHTHCGEVLHDCVLQMLAAHQLSHANELKRCSQLMRFFYTLVDDFNYGLPLEPAPGYSSPYVAQVINYLTINFHKRIRINDLANYIGMNRSYLSDNFRKEMGVSPQEFLINLRLERASLMLQTTHLTIREIAAQVGYDDALGFSKLFKLKYNISPKFYRSESEDRIINHKKGDYQNR